MTNPLQSRHNRLLRRRRRQHPNPPRRNHRLPQARRISATSSLSGVAKPDNLYGNGNDTLLDTDGQGGIQIRSGAFQVDASTLGYHGDPCLYWIDALPHLPGVTADLTLRVEYNGA